MRSFEQLEQQEDHHQQQEDPLSEQQDQQEMTERNSKSRSIQSFIDKALTNISTTPDTSASFWLDDFIFKSSNSNNVATAAELLDGVGSMAITCRP